MELWANLPSPQHSSVAVIPQFINQGQVISLYTYMFITDQDYFSSSYQSKYHQNAIIVLRIGDEFTQ